MGKLSFCSQVLRQPSQSDAGDASHSVIPKTVKCGGCSPPQDDVVNVTQGQEAPDHQVLPIGGAQQMGGFAMRAEHVCRLVLLGVCIGLRFCK